MKLRLLFAIGLVLLLLSCDKTSVYSKLDRNFENNRWPSNDRKTHTFEITDDSKHYNLKLKFSHIYDYQFENVPLSIKIISPDGTTEELSYDLKIKDASGRQLADCTGDVCDLTAPFKENIKLSKGSYTVTIANTFKGAYLPNVLGVGFEVKSAE